MRKPNWDERLERAELLAGTYPFAREILAFYRKLTAFQKESYGYLVAACGSETVKRTGGSLREALDLVVLLPKFPILLALVEHAGPEGLAQLARDLAGRDSNAWMDLLVRYWASDGADLSLGENPCLFFPRAFLQPYAEFLADHTEPYELPTTPNVCPLCSSKPQVGVLRPEGDGARRSLVCSLCLTEWIYRRLICPACGEERDPKLPVYTSEQFDYISVEACDTCKTYIKTVNLAKNGRAVPVVDELAAVPLTLWAEQQGYHKIFSNLLGV
jgi:FdhE protein